MKKVYLLPIVAGDLRNEVFRLRGPAHVNGFAYAREYMLKRGIELKTIDFFDFKNPEPDATLLVLNHPSEGFIKNFYHKIKSIYNGTYYGRQEFFTNHKNYFKFFGKKILLQGECPAIVPDAFRDVNYFKNIYTDVTLSIKTKEFNHFFLPLIRSPHPIPIDKFNNKNRKRLVLVNANKTAFGSKNELYSERLRAIKYFSGSNFDLYGYGWDRKPGFPYCFFSRYIKRAYRGTVEDQISTLSKYKFAACFENAVFEGYLTEKIFNCLFAGTIPIYYGAPDIEKYVPKECFIDFRQFKNYKELDAFLENMTQAQIDSCRFAAFEYLQSPKTELFSEGHFAETIFSLISRGG